VGDVTIAEQVPADSGRKFDGQIQTFRTFQLGLAGITIDL
jgi:hypothetical protein